MSAQDNATELEKSLRRLAHQLNYANNPDQLAIRINEKIAQEGMLNVMVDWRFTSEGETQGAPWKALAPSTQKQRINLGFPGASPILHRSGVLRDHAVTGTQEVSAEGIKMQFRDGPAPVYMGKGRWRRAKKKKVLVGTAEGFAQYEIKQKMLSDYAMALNKIRPFYAPPSDEEWAPIQAKKEELFDRVIQSMIRGYSVGDALAD